MAVSAVERLALFALGSVAVAPVGTRGSRVRFAMGMMLSNSCAGCGFRATPDERGRSSRPGMGRLGEPSDSCGEAAAFPADVEVFLGGNAAAGRWVFDKSGAGAHPTAPGAGALPGTFGANAPIFGGDDRPRSSGETGNERIAYNFSQMQSFVQRRTRGPRVPTGRFRAVVDQRPARSALAAADFSAYAGRLAVNWTHLMVRPGTASW
jgi:hypothetical protein